MAKSYLMRPRGKGFAFRMAVPLALQGKLGRRYIIEGLKTDSPKEAERLAAARRAHWLAAFERAKHDTPLTLGEIEEAARAYYLRLLPLLEAQATIMSELAGGERAWLASLRNLPLDFEVEVAQVARQNGTVINPGTETYSILVDALRRAHTAAIDGRLKALDGQPSTPPPNFLGPAGIDRVTLKPIDLQRPVARLKAEHGPWELFEKWIVDTKPAASTVNRWRAIFLNLQNKFGAKEITEDDAREWARGLVTNARSATTVSEIWLSAARTVYNWAVEEKHASGNPFAKVKVTVPDKLVLRTKAFTPEEAETILRAASAIDPGANAFKGAQRWVPWLQAYSGARAGEICQLRGQDVMQVDGTWIMKLTPDAGTTKTKTFRDVPLHEHLIAQGFLDYVKARGNGPLFYNPEANAKDDDATNPRRPRAVKTRERLAAWIRSRGIADKGVSPTHGFRHLFKTVAARAGIEDRMSDAITGHAPATVAGRYVHPEIKDMADALKRFPRYSMEE